MNRVKLLATSLLLASPMGFINGAGQEYLTPSDVAVGTEKSSQEALAQSAGKSVLRVLGLDLFPRAALVTMYDDNLLITHTNALSDVEWTIAPGFTLAAGDVSLYLPGSVTLSQIRNLLNYSLLDEDIKPERYVGVDYTPSINFFTEHSHYNNVDHTAGLSAGYDFARLAIGLDYDFTRWAQKDNDIGDRVTLMNNDVKLRNRYELTDRSAVEVNFQYRQLRYANNTYQGYDEYRNEDWYNRKMGARLELGAGVAFGLVYPQFTSSQNYQQGFLRGIYHVSGKLDVRARAGVEWRHYDTAVGDTVEPVFNLAAIYRPRVATTITLEGHQQFAPSYGADYNYRIYGFSVGIAQQVTGQIDVELTCGYQTVDYLLLTSGTGNNRTDGYLSLSANVTYEFNPRLKGTLFYNLRDNSSTLSQLSYDNNMAGIRVTWRL